MNFRQLRLVRRKRLSQGETVFTRMHFKELKNEKGAAAVEFALLLPALTLIVLGVMIFGIVFHNYLEITHGAREGVRWTALRSELSDVEARTLAAMPGIDQSKVQINVFVDGTQLTNPADAATDSDQESQAEVTITYDINDIRGVAGFLDSLIPAVISSTARQKVE